MGATSKGVYFRVNGVYQWFWLGGRIAPGMLTCCCPKAPAGTSNWNTQNTAMED
jgi:hypothetical protein